MFVRIFENNELCRSSASDHKLRRMSLENAKITVKKKKKDILGKQGL